MKQFFLFVCLLAAGVVVAQEDLMSMLEEESSSNDPVFATFKGIRLINANTIETTKKKTLEFRIVHRFGNISEASGGGSHTLWGLDNASNIRFSLDYGVTDNLMLGIGRSKTNEHIDGQAKYRFLSQKEKGMPISAAYYVCMAYTPKADPENIYENQSYRMSYAHQVIIASKLASWASVEVLPTFLHRNYVTEYTNSGNDSKETNDMLALGFAGRFKFSKRGAFVIDYFYNFDEYRQDNPDNPYYNPLAMGVELETGGHVFTINVTNVPGIIENDFLVDSPDTWDDGGIKLGFTISRVFNM